MRLLSVLVASIACVIAAPTAQAVSLVLHAEAGVSGPRLRLADVAHIEAVEGKEAEQLGALPLGPAPRQGHALHLSRQQLERAIEAQAPKWRGKLAWKGSESVVVRAESARIDREQLVALAQRTLHAALASGYEKLELRAVDAARETSLPGYASLRARPVMGKPSRRMAVWIEAQADGRAYGAIPVWFEVHAWKAVPVAISDLAAGSVLRSEDFRFESREVLQQADVAEALPEYGVLRTALEKGSALSTAAIEIAPAIRRNQEVAVKIAAGGIMIETSGIAQTNGALGQAVKVKNPQSSEIFAARVTGRGIVTVDVR